MFGDDEPIGNMSRNELIKLIQAEFTRMLDDTVGLNVNELNVARNLAVDGDISVSRIAVESLKRELGL